MGNSQDIGFESKVFARARVFNDIAIIPFSVAISKSFYLYYKAKDLFLVCCLYRVYGVFKMLCKAFFMYKWFLLIFNQKINERLLNG